MARTILNHIARFIFMITIQVLVVNRLDLFDGLLLPFIYIHALLMLPFETPGWMRLLIAFFTGLVVDGFMDTAGLHASACVWMVFVQIALQKLLAPREGYEYGQRPTIQSQGMRWYLVYAGVLAFLFHLWLFLAELFRFSTFFQTSFKALISAIAALLLLILAQFLSLKPRSTN